MIHDDRADDAAFWAAFVLLQSPDEAARSRAWSDAFTWCFDHGDRVAYACVLAAFTEGVRRGRMPPPSAMESLCLIFDTFRAGATFDEAFGMSKPGAGRPQTLRDREMARTRADMVFHFMGKGMSLENAAAHVAELRAFGHGRSAPQIKRDYLRYARSRKANKRA